MRANDIPCYAIRRCLFFFAIVLVTVGFVILVTNGEIFNTTGYEFLNDTKTQTIQNAKGNRVSVMTQSQSHFDLIEQRMKVRRKFLAEKCSENRLDVPGNHFSPKPDPWEFLINRNYHLIWCNVFKAASTSWMYNFNILAGYTPEFLNLANDPPINLARKKYPRVTLKELQKAQNDSKTFIIVRHPFEKLLSAYIDKFIFAVPNAMYDLLGKKIIKMYRKNKIPKPKHPKFSEVVNWLLDQISSNKTIDGHLVSVTKFCTPCLIKFDIIIKFETLDEDQTYLINKAGLQSVITNVWKNAGKGRNIQEVLVKYYSQLTKNQLNGLYNYYKYDFDIFGYTPTSYFDMVKVE